VLGQKPSPTPAPHMPASNEIVGAGGAPSTVLGVGTASPSRQYLSVVPHQPQLLQQYPWNGQIPSPRSPPPHDPDPTTGQSVSSMSFGTTISHFGHVGRGEGERVKNSVGDLVSAMRMTWIVGDIVTTEPILSVTPPLGSDVGTLLMGDGLVGTRVF